MTPNDTLEQLLPELQAIPADSVRELWMPIDVLIQEGHNLRVAACHDWDRLAAYGLRREVVDSLRGRADALMEAFRRHYGESLRADKAAKVKKELKPKAHELRKRLLTPIRFMLRGKADAMARVRQINKGRTEADLVQDLRDIAALIREYADELTAPVLGTEQADEAERMAERLGDLIARLRSNRGLREAKDIRDRAATYLHWAMADVRACGKAVFVDDEKRRRHYASRYRRRLRYGESAEDTSSPAAADTESHTSTGS